MAIKAAMAERGINMSHQTIADICGAHQARGGGMSDRLTLTRALESSGMQSAAAERIATEIYDAIHDKIATKADLALAVRDLKIWFGSLLVAGLTSLFAGLHYWPPHG